MGVTELVTDSTVSTEPTQVSTEPTQVSTEPIQVPNTDPTKNPNTDPTKVIPATVKSTDSVAVNNSSNTLKLTTTVLSDTTAKNPPPATTDTPTTDQSEMFSSTEKTITEDVTDPPAVFDSGVVAVATTDKPALKKQSTVLKQTTVLSVKTTPTTTKVLKELKTSTESIVRTNTASTDQVKSS